MIIMNVLGDELKMKTPGVLSFQLNGRIYQLHPVMENDEKLFIIFRDRTAGKRHTAPAAFSTPICPGTENSSWTSTAPRTHLRLYPLRNLPAPTTPKLPPIPSPSPPANSRFT
jgi:hypothetical protein